MLSAGENAGFLTEQGALLLDPSGRLEAGIPLCPPEGDAGTGMVATNSISAKTGNVSAGTSIFSMVVLENKLSRLYEEIDMVTTPTGKPVAMVHCNNCCTDLDYWVRIFSEFASLCSANLTKPQIYDLLYNEALLGDADCGGLLAYNYFSGEHVTCMEEGRPLFVRTPESKFNLANFMRLHLFTALGALKVGNDILFGEGVKLDRITGHGGLFKTKGVGQKIMAAALNVPVTVMETAGEGGAWGMALLAAYMVQKNDGEKLEEYLENRVFAGQAGETLAPDAKDVEGFNEFIKRYVAGLPIERAAIDAMK